MKAAVADVEKFMRAAGQETPSGPCMTETAKLYFGDPALAGYAAVGIPVMGGLVGEEMRELAEAWANRDDVGLLDGAIDTIWTIIAGLRALGFPITEGWIEVALSNHAKIDPDTGVCLRRADGKILKPEGWQPPNLRRVMNEHGLNALKAMLGSGSLGEFGDVCVRSEPYDEDRADLIGHNGNEGLHYEEDACKE